MIKASDHRHSNEPTEFRGLASLHDVFRDGRLRHFDPKLEQFPVQPRRSPQDIPTAHLPDQFPDVLRCRRASTASSSALPPPVEPESVSVPPDNRIGLDEHQSLSPLAPEAIQGDPQEPVHGTKRDSSSLGPLQNAQLVAEGQDLKLQRDPGSNCGEQRDQQRSQDNVHGSGR